MSLGKTGAELRRERILFLLAVLDAPIDVKRPNRRIQKELEPLIREEFENA